MSGKYPGAIDCDTHPFPPNTRALLPYLSEYWRDQILNRQIDGGAFHLQSYPPNSPLTCRADWRPSEGFPGSDFELFKAQALDGFGARFAILNCMHGSIALFNEDLSAALVSAVNDWIAAEWLDRDSRLRASILLPMHNPETAVREIERLAHDRRFVGALVPVMGEMPLGRRIYWPIYRAAEKHGLTITMHAGGLYRQAPSSMGWPSFQVEDYVNQNGAFENQLVSFVSEGVFHEFPKLTLVCAESGFTWLPTLLWRFNKTWRGARAETPWVDRRPGDIIRDHVRFTLQPIDAPGDSQKLLRTLVHMDAEDLLLFSTDYPHWQFDGDNAIPEGLPETAARKMMVDNPLAAYPRLNAEFPR